MKKCIAVLFVWLLISNICIANSNQLNSSESSGGGKNVIAPLHSKAFVNTRWNSIMYFPKINKEIRTIVDVNRNTNGELSLKIKYAGSNQCLGQLYQEKVYKKGYLVKLSSNPETSCQSSRVRRGYIYFNYFMYKSWPVLVLYNADGQMVANGSLGGMKGGLPNVDPKLAKSGTDSEIKAMEDKMALARLEAVTPQTLFTQCRILEYKMGTVGKPEWCMCIDEQYSQILTPEEYAAAVKDYLNFRRRSSKQPGPGDDRRLLAARDHCQDCYQKDYKGGCLQNDNSTPNGKNYTRIINTLLKGDYKSIEKGILFKNFFIDYVHSYSDWCGKNNIRSGQYRRRISWEEDQNGYQIGHTEVKEVYIERSHLDLYDRYLLEVDRDDVGEVLSTAASGAQSFMNYTINKVTNLISARIAINNHLNKGCGSTSVQKVYKALIGIDSSAPNVSDSSSKPGSSASPGSAPVKKAGDKKTINQDTVGGPKLGNPSGYYYVYDDGISHISATRSGNKDNYSINHVIVSHKEKTLRPGSRAAVGKWYPSYQQFYNKQYITIPNRTECNQAAPGSASWSSVIIADDKIPIGNGQVCSGYRFTGQAPFERQPSERICVRYNIDKNCGTECTQWRKRDPNQKGYLVKRKSDAIKLYRHFNGIVSAPAPSQNSRQSNDSTHTFDDSWSATFDGQTFELVLWPVPKKTDQFRGFMYYPLHDCLMTANLNKYGDNFNLHFVKAGAIDREKNCMLNNDFRGVYKHTFKGNGKAEFRKAKGSFMAEIGFLTLGKPIAQPKDSKKVNLHFRRTKASAKMLELIEAHGPQSVGLPEADFLTRISK